MNLVPTHPGILAGLIWCLSLLLLEIHECHGHLLSRRQQASQDTSSHLLVLQFFPSPAPCIFLSLQRLRVDTDVSVELKPQSSLILSFLTNVSLCIVFMLNLFFVHFLCQHLLIAQIFLPFHLWFFLPFSLFTILYLLFVMLYSISTPNVFP